MRPGSSSHPGLPAPCGIARFAKPQAVRLQPRRAVVLLLVLVIVVVLTLSAYRYSESMTAEFKAADSTVRAVQVQALAESGINYAAALLSNPDNFQNTLNRMPWNNPQAFQSILVLPNDNAHFRGRFSVLAPLSADESPTNPPYRYGVIDEASKINLNALMALDPKGKLLRNWLAFLPNMTDDIADAILDWLDADNQPRANGAEESYYQALVPPYHCKNGPLDSLEELLLVRGVTVDLLFGNDRNRNGVLDPEENDGSGFFDRGWSAYLTIYSREQDVDAQNNPRINVNSADVQQLYEKLIPAVGQDMAYYIAAYRLYGPASNQLQQQLQLQFQAAAALNGKAGANGDGSKSSGSGGGKQPAKAPSAGSASASNNNKKTPTPAAGATGTDTSTQPKQASRGERDDLDFSRKPAKNIGSLYELIGTTVNVPNKQKGMTHYDCPLNDTGTLRQTLPLLLDKATTRKSSEIPARININTAPFTVLAGLPGLSSDDVQKIINLRPNPSAAQAPDLIYQTPAWLITEADLNPVAVQKLEPYITTRSQSYRVQSIGYFDQDGPNARIEAVIDTNVGRPRIVYRRDLTDLGQAYQLEKAN